MQQREKQRLSLAGGKNEGALFFEQREDEGEDVVGDDLVPCGGGVGVVGLHHAVDAVDVL